MPSKNKNLPQPQTSRIIALHRDVDDWLDLWRKDHLSIIFAAKFVAFLRELECGAFAQAQVLQKQVFHKHLHDEPILEYGRKQRGGAPRIFGTVLFSSYIFLAADVEKSNHGCKGIGISKERLKAIKRRIGTQPKSLDDWQSQLGQEYRLLITEDKGDP